MSGRRQRAAAAREYAERRPPPRSSREPYFRALERTVLRELFAERHVIVATGDGTFAETDNRHVINRDGASIWLNVTFEQVIERIPPDGSRPRPRRGACRAHPRLAGRLVAAGAADPVQA